MQGFFDAIAAKTAVSNDNLRNQTVFGGLTNTMPDKGICGHALKSALGISAGLAGRKSGRLGGKVGARGRHPKGAALAEEWFCFAGMQNGHGQKLDLWDWHEAQLTTLGVILRCST